MKEKVFIANYLLLFKGRTRQFNMQNNMIIGNNIMLSPEIIQTKSWLYFFKLKIECVCGLNVIVS